MTQIALLDQPVATEASACADCAAAVAALTSRFTTDCRGCSVRAIAGGPDYYYSAKAGGMTQRYRELLRFVFGSAWQDAHAEVRLEAERLARFAR